MGVRVVKGRLFWRRPRRAIPGIRAAAVRAPIGAARPAIAPFRAHVVSVGAARVAESMGSNSRSAAISGSCALT